MLWWLGYRLTILGQVFNSRLSAAISDSAPRPSFLVGPVVGLVTTTARLLIETTQNSTLAVTIMETEDPSSRAARSLMGPPPPSIWIQSLEVQGRVPTIIPIGGLSGGLSYSVEISGVS